MGIECLLTNSSLTSVRVEPGSMSAFFKRYGPKYPPIAPVLVAICARVCWRPKASRRASMACPYTSRLLLPASIPIGFVQLSHTYFCHCASRTGFHLAYLGCAALSTVGRTGGGRLCQSGSFFPPSLGFPCFRSFLPFSLSSCHESLHLNFIVILFIAPFRKLLHIAFIR